MKTKDQQKKGSESSEDESLDESSEEDDDEEQSDKELSGDGKMVGETSGYPKSDLRRWMKPGSVWTYLDSPEGESIDDDEEEEEEAEADSEDQGESDEQEEEEADEETKDDGKKDAGKKTEDGRKKSSKNTKEKKDKRSKKDDKDEDGEDDANKRLALAEKNMAKNKVNSTTHRKEYMAFDRWKKSSSRFPAKLQAALTTKASSAWHVLT